MARSNSNNTALIYGPKHRNRYIVFFITFLLFFSGASATVFAHRVVVFAWIEGDMVYTQSKFPGGARVSNGAITVYDETGRALLTGKTDDQGEFSFPLPALQSPSELKVVLNAGMGHQGYWVLKREEVGRALGLEVPSGVSTVGGEKDAAVQSGPTRTPSAVLEADMPCPLDEKALKRIVEAAVDRKLSPVMDMLISIREESAIGLDDVVAGLGYIFGLTGLLAWFYSRKKE